MLTSIENFSPASDIIPTEKMYLTAKGSDYLSLASLTAIWVC